MLLIHKQSLYVLCFSIWSQSFPFISHHKKEQKYHFNLWAQKDIKKKTSCECTAQLDFALQITWALFTTCPEINQKSEQQKPWVLCGSSWFCGDYFWKTFLIKIHTKTTGRRTEWEVFRSPGGIRLWDSCPLCLICYPALAEIIKKTILKKGSPDSWIQPLFTSTLNYEMNKSVHLAHQAL